LLPAWSIALDPTAILGQLFSEQRLISLFVASLVHHWTMTLFDLERAAE
jgi:hypothetical protein